MVGFRVPGPYCYFTQNLDAEILDAEIDVDEIKRSPDSSPGPVGTHVAKKNYSYSISGTVGALGSMLFTEMSNLPGTLYDRTAKTNMAISREADLGMSKFANKEFRKSAKIMRRNLQSPSKVDVDIRFETKDRVETITVRGQKGIRTFRFDFDRVEANAKKLPKNADVFKPFMDTIAKIIDAVIALR